jgi:hypothetical protein
MKNLCSLAVSTQVSSGIAPERLGLLIRLFRLSPRPIQGISRCDVFKDSTQPCLARLLESLNLYQHYSVYITLLNSSHLAPQSTTLIGDQKRLLERGQGDLDSQKLEITPSRAAGVLFDQPK